MEGKLDEEYKQFEAANAEYQKRTFKLQEHFMNTAETFQNPKSYFDVSYMYSALNELKSELQQAEKLEAQAIAQTTEVNSRVALHLLGIRSSDAFQQLHKRPHS